VDYAYAVVATMVMTGAIVLSRSGGEAGVPP
jgi:hypothetical protein